MTTYARTFGSDLTNTFQPRSLTKKETSTPSPKTYRPVLSETKPVELKIVQEIKEELIECSTPHKSFVIETVISAPNPSTLRYSIDFLLSLREKSKGPIEGLLPEVLPGYVEPGRTYITSTFADTHNKSSFIRPNSQKIDSLPQTTLVYRPKEVVQPVKEITVETVPAVVIAEPKQETSIERKSKDKKPKKEKARETDERRLVARQKQLDIGKNTIGYKKYAEQTCISKRTKGDPKTPEKHQVCSKRSWDGQVRKWRRQLHLFDPNEVLEENLLEDEVEEEEESEKLESNGVTINLGVIFATMSTRIVS